MAQPDALVAPHAAAAAATEPPAARTLDSGRTIRTSPHPPRNTRCTATQRQRSQPQPAASALAASSSRPRVDPQPNSTATAGGSVATQERLHRRPRTRTAAHQCHSSARRSTRQHSSSGPRTERSTRREHEARGAVREEGQPQRWCHEPGHQWAPGSGCACKGDRRGGGRARPCDGLV